MILETERLILREYVQADYDALYPILSDPETMKYYPKPYDEKGVQRWLDWSFDNYRKYGFGLWAAVLKETGEFVGDCGLTMQQIDGEDLPEVGYHIRKERWRQGLAREASRAVRDWAFTHTGFHCLYSYMNAANLPSRATAAANGMKLIKEFNDTRWGHRTAVYAVSRQEWEALGAEYRAQSTECR
ncbi:MAG: GNAT family N-acetyltransferase [Clostridia bacterium]|nr:GNAT family N-acetyltransferase [Clostridia bacterium]